MTQVLADGTNTYLYGLGRIAEQVSTTWTYYHPDALGSVRQLSDSTGTLTLGQSFEPYGDILESAGTGSSSFGFTGEWKDGTGLLSAPSNGALLETFRLGSSQMIPQSRKCLPTCS